MMKALRDVGDTLIEILLTIVIISLTVTALVSSLATTANAGTAQRNSVQADIALRNYAEAAKVAVQSCVVGATTPATFGVTYEHPVGFTVTANSNLCPTNGSDLVPLTLTVSHAGVASVPLHIVVRIP
jgi:type II secretory pathway pseudopilin PulG